MWISAPGLVELGGTTGLGMVVNSLWNGSKSGWGGGVWAEENVAMAGAQLGQAGPDSAVEEDTPSSTNDILLGPHCQLCHLYNLTQASRSKE